MFYNESKGIVIKTTNLKSNIKLNDRKAFGCGGIFSDCELSWVYNGSSLQVANISDGAILSSWDFSTITHDPRTQVNCVIEYPVSDQSRLATKGNQICLIVSYTSKKDYNKCSYISFCHPRTSRILHTITTKEKVTCLSLITAKKNHLNPISGLLKFMSGALALGTQTGQLLIVDIKDVFTCVRRNSRDSYHNRFAEMTIMDLKRHSENEIKDKLSKLDHSSQHVAISLSDKKDSDTEICTLKYIPEGTMLAVGLKSGVFHLWDVNTLKKLYKSSSLEVPIPIAAFGFQEPCNDPQNFCYLWVLHEADQKFDSCLPFAVMYGILYKRVNSIPSFGRHYRNFVHCKKRFDLDVDLERCVGGRCISSSVVSNTPSNMLRHTAMNEEDPSKINLFVMVFETWERGADINSCISLVVFDMNQWYKAQMPHQCYPGYSVPFVNFMLLEQVSERKLSILDVCIKKDTIQQFLTFNLSEEYSYPSSLSFDTIFLSSEKIIHLRVPGAQRSVLEKIISDGPSGIMNPSKFYTLCKEAGLRPSFSDYNSNVIVPSQIQQRNYILTILLENKVSSYLVRCVKEWADGSRAVSGCTLHHLIQWAWDCVIRIKQLTDIICVPLFDYSGDDLDRENYQKLKHCCQLIHIIRDLLAYIHKNYKQYLLDDSKLNHQKETLQFVTKYFDVIIWCLDCGLLPEKVSTSTDKCVPIYMMNIIQYTEQRREELKKIAAKDKYFLIENSTIYIVDSVLENESGRKLLTQWQRESGGMTTGLYPPVTLQSLLRMFLMIDLPNEIKHFIMIYFLLDVCDYHRDEEMKEQLLSFPIVFSIELPFFSLVQACWYLDHEKFEEAADILMLSTVNALLQNQNALNKTILQACVCQKQYALALKLERLIQLSGFVFKDDRFYITLLLQNGLVMEAYTTLKKTSFYQKKLLRHFFLVCDDFGLLKEIFKFPLTSEEEEEFMQYLDECTNKDAGDLKIMYLLSRARYVEAVDMNHNLAMIVPKFSIVGKDTLIQTSKSGRTTTRDLLVNAFSKTLPAVTNELITFCQKEKEKLYRFKEVTRPTPLSVVVRSDNTQQVPTYKSSFENVMQAAITKTAEMWKNFPTLNRNKRNHSLMKETPFLRSDIMTPRSDKTNLIDRRKNTSERSEDTEPPSKRIKSARTNTTTYDLNEMNETEIHSSPSAEVTKILLTPHVQKRLNKLLQSTPESSPLTSILKSSEIPRMRQPQKVGFSIPEVSKRTPRKILADAEVSVHASPSEKQNEGSIQKPFEDFERSPTSRRADLNNQTVPSPEKLRLSPASLSPNNSAGIDSYYSLDSDNEGFCNEECKRTEPPMPQSVIVETNSGKAVRHFVESMSEEESAAEEKKRIFLEVMSEPESVEGEQNTNAPSLVASSVREYDVNVSLHRESCITRQSMSQNINICQSESKEAVNLSNEQEVSVINSVPTEPIESAVSSFLADENLEEVPDQYKSEENLSYVPLQPVVEPCNENKTELMVTSLTSWQKIYDECKSGGRYSNQFDHLEEETEAERLLDQNDQESRSMENVPVVIEQKFSSYEYKDIKETEGKECTGDSADHDDVQSVTEITDTSNTEDSDVEIVEENVVQSASGILDEATTEENDDSEKTYESDFPDLNGSLADDSTIAGSSIRDDDEINVNDFEDDLAEEYEEEEDKESIEGNEDEALVEDEDLEEEEEQEDEEEEEEIEEKNKKIMNYNEKAFYENNPGIDFDELKKIVSNVAAAEAKAAEKKGTTESEFKMPLITSSYSLNENEGSVNEVFNATPSVVEETIYIDYSDTSQAAKSFAEESSNKIMVSEHEEQFVDIDTVPNNESSNNKTSKLDTSIEVQFELSMPSEKESEAPPMVFYFGENSVTSISDDVLGEESQEHDKSQSSSKEIPSVISTCLKIHDSKSKEITQTKSSSPPKNVQETFTFDAGLSSAALVNQTEITANAENNNLTSSSSVDLITVSTTTVSWSSSILVESVNQNSGKSILIDASRCSTMEPISKDVHTKNTKYTDEESELFTHNVSKMPEDGSRYPAVNVTSQQNSPEKFLVEAVDSDAENPVSEINEINQETKEQVVSMPHEFIQELSFERENSFRTQRYSPVLESHCSVKEAVVPINKNISESVLSVAEKQRILDKAASANSSSSTASIATPEYSPLSTRSNFSSEEISSIQQCPSNVIDNKESRSPEKTSLCASEMSETVRPPELIHSSVEGNRIEEKLFSTQTSSTLMTVGSKIPENQYSSVLHVAELTTHHIVNDAVTSETESRFSPICVKKTPSAPMSSEKSATSKNVGLSLHDATPLDTVPLEKIVSSCPGSPVKPEYSPLSSKSYRSSRSLSPSSSSSFQSDSSKVMQKLASVQSEMKQRTTPVAVEAELVDHSVNPAETVKSDTRTLTPRRSLRVARRQSVGSIPDTDNNQPAKSNTSSAPLVRRRTRRRSIGPLTQTAEDDDAVSVKSECGDAESVSSRSSTLSTQSQKRKRSYSRLEMRKSTVPYQHKKLEVIVSDEEETSPAKSNVMSGKISARRRRVSASAEPELESLASRRSTRRRSVSGASEDDKLSTKSDTNSKVSSRKRSAKSKDESKTLNEAILQTPTPLKAKSRKLVCSTPVGKSQRTSEPSAAVIDYTKSRRLTRHQKSLLECGIKRVEESEKDEKDQLVTSRILEDVPEENESFDLEKDIPEDSTFIDDEDVAQVIKLPKSQAVGAKKCRKRTTVVLEEPGTSSVRRKKYADKPDDSTDDSISSKISTNSRQSKGRPSTYTNLALRKSSVRRSFKPLAVIPSDEDSLSLSTPSKTSRNAEEELVISSPDSTHSKQSASKRITRSQKVESDQSDRESSVMSDATTVSIRQTRRSLMEDITRTEKTERSAGSSEEKTGTGYSTRTQKGNAEQVDKLSTRKKK